jgi:hypothetical protein
MGRKKSLPKKEKTETNKVKFYKHRFMNCHLTLNPVEVGTGARSISITLQKGKGDEWGLFDTDDEEKQKLLPQHPLFGKQIFEITEEEFLAIPKREKPELYHRGVMGALQGKMKR